MGSNSEFMKHKVAVCLGMLEMPMPRESFLMYFLCDTNILNYLMNSSDDFNLHVVRTLVLTFCTFLVLCSSELTEPV